MAFGMRKPQAGTSDWKELYFHQKVMHLVDHASDWVFGRVSGAAGVAIGGAVVLSAFVFGGEAAIPELINLASAALSPVLAPPTFGVPMGPAPGGPQGGGGGGDDDDEDLDLDE